ncbi:MAG: PhnE/PtxC family ABC transporter permease [Candidatus Tectimicrobiota bacterium]
MFLARPAPERDPAWTGRLSALLVFLALLFPMGYLTEFNPAVFFDATSLRASRQFLSTFLPPAHSPDFLLLTLRSAWKTVAIATAGMTLALTLALPLSLVATQALSISRLGTGRMHLLPAGVRLLLRSLLTVLRSVPELVWALLFVRAVGLGDTAGVLAITLTYTGMVGKVFLEIYAAQDTRAAEALLLAGAGRLSAFCYGTLPACLPELLSYTIYRWECAIRSSVILGFVGAGGLGQQMELSMRMLAGGEVLSFLCVFMLLVWLADQVSKRLRTWLD